MSAFVAQVPLRWTDQDAYRHVNHARIVTLIEEARVALAFTGAGEEGLTGFASGLLVAGLNVEYKRQLPWRAEPLRVEITVRDLRAASFTLDYLLRDGSGPDDPVAVTAWTKMALVDLGAGRPRRLTDGERDYLKRHLGEVS
ncbi:MULTISPECIES: acyl-CoA thioesterase [Pseudonocardia]|uniref:Thioesterase superfamily protein n=2 Tax=Pseudonocardia TaxID=1847 RepID=A0A1Y2MNW3_PSEAH|nr:MULTISPECIES: thioesterase family protein [Pseudonocardia]OSY36148.1 Thioesterase superfamily protein [Pseudonocardia autotrophica]TDN76581.1 acyl-CoA thioester hydrolase [Pseudonocardia autotrophica]BBG00582.1 thioesterase [Pseudonocardia autotrophica]GEC26966.1 thioesterase [Pseudonocardia saturnea]